MRVFHLALASDWEIAEATGRYLTSTRGRSLREVGFIHAAHADQWQQVRRDLYAEETEPLVLLTIDTDLLEAPVVEEAAPGAEETFPHIYGVLNLDAVIAVTPLSGRATADGEPAPDPPPAALPEGDPALLDEDSAPPPVPAALPPGLAARAPKTFMQLFVEEMAFRAMLGFAVMVFAGAIGFTAQQVYGDDVAFPVTLAALALGIAVAWRISRRRDAGR